MRPRSWAVVVLLAAPLLAASPVLAQTQLSEEDCLKKSPKCTCADAPLLELYLKNKKDGRAAWQTVYDGLGKPYGASNTKDARTAQGVQLGPADPRIDKQYQTCPSGAPGPVGTIAGVSGFGTAWVDQCACEAFCQDIVEATILHEKIHPPTLLYGFFSSIETQTLCRAGIVPQSHCDLLDAYTLATSEILAYTAQILSLESTADALAETPDATAPKGLCTWKAIAAVTPPTDTAVPKSLWARLVNLADRFVNGVAG